MNCNEIGRKFLQEAKRRQLDLTPHEEYREFLAAEALKNPSERQNLEQAGRHLYVYFCMINIGAGCA